MSRWLFWLQYGWRPLGMLEYALFARGYELGVVEAEGVGAPTFCLVRLDDDGLPALDVPGEPVGSAFEPRRVVLLRALREVSR